MRLPAFATKVNGQSLKSSVTVNADFHLMNNLHNAKGIDVE